MAFMLPIGLQIEAGTSPSKRTRETASAPRAASRRPRASCDVHAELFESASHLTDDTGFIVIAQIKDGSGELGFERNSVNRQHARGAVVQNGALGSETDSAGLFRSVETSSVFGKPCRGVAFLLPPINRERRRQRCVNNVHFFVEDRI